MKSLYRAWLILQTTSVERFLSYIAGSFPLPWSVSNLDYAKHDIVAASLYEIPPEAIFNVGNKKECKS